MNDLTTLSYLLLHNKGVFCLFLGSGISRQAGIPTGWEIINDQISKLAAIEQETIIGEPSDWYLTKYDKQADYSDLLEQLTNTPAERVNALKAYFEPNAQELEDGLKTPTAAHREIAKLIKKGLVKVVVTTNFDRLLEHALKEEGIEPVVIANADQVENTQPIIHNDVTIIKVNGDYLDPRFLNIRSELESYDPRMEALLKTIFENFGLITCGWSATWDIAIPHLLKSANKFRYSNYFTYRGKPTAELSEVSNARKGYLLEIGDADSFFKNLTDNTDSFERLQSQHPATKELAIARLKKLITREENKVDLFDLLSAESKRSFELIDKRPFPYPNQESFKTELDFAFAQIDIIANLLANGIYWGKNYHDSLWLQIYTRFLYPTDRSMSWSTWNQFQQFPGFYLFSIMSVSAVIARNFSLLKDLLYQWRYTRNSGPKERLILEYQPDKVIEGQLLTAFIGEKYTPMSDFILQNIQPIFSPYFSQAVEFDDQFDYFEYCFALVYITLSDENWCPLGRFAWRMKRSRHGDTYVQGKIKTAEIQKDTFELVGSLFETYEAYAAANKKLMDYIAGVRY